MSRDGPGPVFVGGVERSGTTLLGSLLGRHPRAICVPESQFKTRVLKRLQAGGHISRETLIEELKKYFRFDLWDIPVEELDGLLSSTITDGTWFRTLCERYAAVSGSESVSGDIVPVDHTPSNMLRARLLRESFPGARFLHIVRDGRGVAHSALPLAWGPNTILEAPHYWGRKLSCGLMAEQALEDDRIRRVYFENLVRRPGDTLESICEFLGLSFEEAMVETGSYSVPDYTRDQHRLVEKSPDPDRADAWQSGLSARKQELFEYYAEPWLDHLGYPLLFQPYPRRPTRLERWKYFWVDLLRVPLQKIRYRLRRLRR